MASKKKPVKKTAKKPVKKAPAKAKAKPKAKPAVKAKAQPKAKAKIAAAKKAVAIKKPAPKISAQPKKSNIDYTKAITPLGDRLVVRVSANERVTAGGLIIPDSASSAVGFLKAEVLAVGRGTQNKKGHLKPMDVQVGDSVLFSQYAGTKVKFNSEELQIIQETDVMGVVQN